MIGTFNLSQAAIEFGGTLLSPDNSFSRLSTDSRTIKAGDVFVALQGENFDGHDYLSAVANLASGFVVSQANKDIEKPQWVVSDTTIALGQLARLNRSRFIGLLIALTGSTGKTTVKDMVAAILCLCGEVLATKDNFNNHIGVPKTLLNLSDEHRFAVIEMGASAVGEIAYLSEMAQPHIALVNNVMSAHLEGFGSEAAIAETKGAVYSSLLKGGVAIINLDDPWVYKWQDMAGSAQVLSYSMTDPHADIGLEGDEVLSVDGSRFTLRIGEIQQQVFLPLPGRHNIANALAAAACAYAAGASIDIIAAGLETMKPVKGRVQTLEGHDGSLIFDDTYNANPGSVKAAIDVLASRAGERILVLGDMAELGSMSSTSHREMGNYARSKGIEQLFAVGQFATHTARGFGDQTKIFANKPLLIAALKPELKADVTVLVKGSRSAAMEEVVAELILEEAHAVVAN